MKIVSQIFKSGLIGIFIWVLAGCSFEDPKQFSEISLTEPLKTLDGSTTTFKDVLETHKGKTLVINVWASWCKDCYVGLPNFKELQKEFPNVDYVFLSLDRTEERWKRSLSRYSVKGEHYFMANAKKGPLGDFLGLWWIPRYVVVDTDGTIKLFKAKKSSDPNIREALKN